jgi:excisionase family DNA binding protein
MSLRTAVEMLVAAAPADATIPVRWLAEQLEADGARDITMPTDARVSVDLTVEELAAKLNRGTSTIRTWLARGDLPGAYRNHGREWRIPSTAVEAMQRAQAKRQPPVVETTAVELSDWRRHLPQTRPI